MALILCSFTASGARAQVAGHALRPLTFIKCSYYKRDHSVTVSMVGRPRSCDTAIPPRPAYRGYRLRDLVWHGWGRQSAYAEGRWYQGGFAGSTWAIVAVFRRRHVCDGRRMYTRYRVTTKFGTSHNWKLTPICGDY